MPSPLNRRRALIAGGAGLVALASGGIPVLLSRTRAQTEGLWVAPKQREPESSPSPTPEPTPEMLAFDLTKVDATKLVNVTTTAWHSWALMDRGSGAIIGSANFNQTNRACSMIKTWIAADYLSQAKSPTKTRQDQITIMIRDSDSITADEIMDELGRLKSLNRLKAACKTTDFVPSNSWSKQVISARDACRMGDTIAAGRVANPQWTEWLLGLMRNVRRGTWGIREAFPADVQATMAIKNGWDSTAATATYHANCLAVTERWAMSVLTRYPTKVQNSESLGAEVTEDIAAQLLKSSELRPLLG